MNVLAGEILAYIQSDDHDEATFTRLALGLFAYQYERNEPYRRLCDSAGISPETIARWQEIPAAPALAFKRCELTCVPFSETAAVFHSSGTTGDETSRHYFDADALALYEASLRRGFADAMPADRPDEIWALMPPPDAAPNSSLSHMLGTLKASRFFWNDDAALAAALRERREPVLVFGTAFAFVGLWDSTDESWSLPPGSIIVETGGFKGRTREVAREDLYALFGQRFGVPTARCYSEYGMSEMASQFYGRDLDPVKRGPAWVRTMVIDPETGEEAAEGEPGLLTHCDLANFNSVCALQTQDLGRRVDGGFILMGRASDAELRGCSLSVEELWSSR